MKSKTWLFVLSLVAVVALVLSGCAAPQPEAPKPETPKPETPKEPFKIGVTASITGYAAITYGPGSDALGMYFMDLNERGGIDGREVELFIEDDRSEPPRAVSNFKAITEREDVDLLIACVPSALMPGSVAEAERANLPLIIMGCVPKWVFPPDTHPLVYTSLCNCLFDYPTIMSRIVDDYLGGESTKIGLLGMDIPGSRLMTEMYVKLYKDLGHDPIDAYVPAGTTDLTPIALKFKDAGVEYCQFYGPGGLGPVLVKAMYKIGWEGTQLTGWWNPVEFEIETVQGTGEKFL